MRRPAFVPSFLLALACGPAEPAPEPSEPAPAASSASEARAEPPSRRLGVIIAKLSPDKQEAQFSKNIFSTVSIV